MMIYQLLVQQTNLVVGFGINQLAQRLFHSDSTIQIVFHRIYHLVIGHSTFYDIISFPRFLTFSTGDDEIQPAAVISVKAEATVKKRNDR